MPPSNAQLKNTAQKKPLPEVGQPTQNKPEISYIEWYLVIGALFMIDVIQLALDLLAEVGVLVNRFIDIAVGMSLAFYLQMRGQSLAEENRAIILITTFFAEEIPDIDALPFWTFDGVYYMFLDKGPGVLAKISDSKAVKGVNVLNRASMPGVKTASRFLPGGFGKNEAEVQGKIKNLKESKKKKDVGGQASEEITRMYPNQTDVGKKNNVITMPKREGIQNTQNIPRTRQTNTGNFARDTIPSRKIIPIDARKRLEQFKKTP